MLEPEAAVGALAGTTATQEHIGSPIMRNDGGMDHERIVWGCAEGIKKHHGIAERKLSITGHIVITDIDDIVLKVFRRDQYAVRMISGI